MDGIWYVDFVLAVPMYKKKELCEFQHELIDLEGMDSRAPNPSVV